jgi:hypothetical protein
MIRILILLFFVTFESSGQLNTSQKPIGKFLSDSIHLGEIVNYSLVFRHNSKQEVFFTDKGYNYAPFELVEKVYFPTETNNGISIDSAIYQLRTFNIEKNQSISIPIYIKVKKDSILNFPVKDSVNIIEEIKGSLTQLSLKEKATLIPMKYKINIIDLFLKIGIFIIVVTIWWLLFGKTIKSHLKILNIYRSHNEFKSIFKKHTKTLNKTSLENALITWKKYMESLHNKSFLTMTTPEIIDTIPNDNLSEALSDIDKSIYGNNVSEKINNSFETLIGVAEHFYNLRKKEFVLTNKISKLIKSDH